MHFIVRLLVNPKTGISEVIGYLTYKEGIGTALFAGAPSEKTAHFTLRIPDLRSVSMNNTGKVSVQVRPPGALLQIYLKEHPDQDWDNPESFSNGKLIATYYEGVAQLINMGPVAESTATFDLIFNEDFAFKGKTYNFGSGALMAVTAVSYFNSSAIPTHASKFQFAVSGAGVGYRVKREGNTSGSHDDGVMEGSFIDTINQPDRRMMALFTFTREGGMVGNTMTREGQPTMANGAWVRVGDREFALTFAFLGQDDTVTYIRLKVRARIRLNESFDQYTGIGQMDYYDRQGNLIRSIRAPVNGKRINADVIDAVEALSCCA